MMKTELEYLSAAAVLDLGGAPEKAREERLVSEIEELRGSLTRRLLFACGSPRSSPILHSASSLKSEVKNTKLCNYIANTIHSWYLALTSKIARLPQVALYPPRGNSCIRQ